MIATPQDLLLIKLECLEEKLDQVWSVEVMEEFLAEVGLVSGLNSS